MKILDSIKNALRVRRIKKAMHDPKTRLEMTKRAYERFNKHMTPAERVRIKKYIRQLEVEAGQKPTPWGKKDA